MESWLWGFDIVVGVRESDGQPHGEWTLDVAGRTGVGIECGDGVM